MGLRPDLALGECDSAWEVAGHEGCSEEDQYMSQCDR
jgi:hypothetical protein